MLIMGQGTAGFILVTFQTPERPLICCMLCDVTLHYSCLYPDLGGGLPFPFPFLV